MNKNVLKGKEWQQHLIKNKFVENAKRNAMYQLEIYRCTWNYNAIYFLDGYYFSFAIPRGYKNLTSLKRLLS